MLQSKATEQQTQGQERWNTAYGQAGLRVLESNPESFPANSSCLPPPQLALLERAGDLRGQRVLELGSGTGVFAAILAKLGASVTGLDLGMDLVRLGTRVAARNQVPAQFSLGRAESLPFAAGSFDLVVGNGILHHLSRGDVVKALSETHRVLVPGGRALFVEPVENSPIFDFLQNLIPVGDKGSANYRPSILQRKAWRTYLKTADDRSMDQREFLSARGALDLEELLYFGLLSRLGRVLPGPRIAQALKRIDEALLHPWSPFRSLAREALVEYQAKQPGPLNG